MGVDACRTGWVGIVLFKSGLSVYFEPDIKDLAAAAERNGALDRKRSGRGGRRSSSPLSARRWATTTTRSRQPRTYASPAKASPSRPSPCATRSGRSIGGYAMPATAWSKSTLNSPSPGWPASPCRTASRPGTAPPSAGTCSPPPESGSPMTSAPPERQPEPPTSSTRQQQHGRHASSPRARRARCRTRRRLSATGCRPRSGADSRSRLPSSPAGTGQVWKIFCRCQSRYLAAGTSPPARQQQRLA